MPLLFDNVISFVIAGQELIEDEKPLLFESSKGL